MSWLTDEKLEVADPQKMKFSFREWVWGLWAFIHFWNKKFHAPYSGMTVRQALILMRLRNERPATVQEILAAIGCHTTIPAEVSAFAWSFGSSGIDPVERTRYVEWRRNDGLKFYWVPEHRDWSRQCTFIVRK